MVKKKCKSLFIFKKKKKRLPGPPQSAYPNLKCSSKALSFRSSYVCTRALHINSAAWISCNKGDFKKPSFIWILVINLWAWVCYKHLKPASPGFFYGKKITQFSVVLTWFWMQRFWNPGQSWISKTDWNRPTFIQPTNPMMVSEVTTQSPLDVEHPLSTGRKEM